MNCTVCGKETAWLEHIGKDFVCNKCLNKCKLMGNIFRTHIDSFHFLVKKLNIQSYKELNEVTKKDVLQHVNLGRVLNT